MIYVIVINTLSHMQLKGLVVIQSNTFAFYLS